LGWTCQLREAAGGYSEADKVQFGQPWWTLCCQRSQYAGQITRIIELEVVEPIVSCHGDDCVDRASSEGEPVIGRRERSG